MAGSRFAYVRSFELPDPLLPHTFILFRLDGHSFHKYFLFYFLIYLLFNLIPTVSLMLTVSQSLTTNAPSNLWIMLPVL
jgi:hypothetical protein